MSMGTCLLVAAEAAQLGFAGSPCHMCALAGSCFLLLDGTPQLKQLLLHLRTQLFDDHLPKPVSTAGEAVHSC